MGQSLFSGSSCPLWSGQDWGNSRHVLSVVAHRQYRMQGPLAGIGEWFADGMQTVEDAQALAARVLTTESSAEFDFHKEFAGGRQKTHILCTDNNSKAASE